MYPQTKPILSSSISQESREKKREKIDKAVIVNAFVDPYVIMACMLFVPGITFHFLPSFCSFSFFPWFLSSSPPFLFVKCMFYYTYCFLWNKRKMLHNDEENDDDDDDDDITYKFQVHATMHTNTHSHSFGAVVVKVLGTHTWCIKSHHHNKCFVVFLVHFSLVSCVLRMDIVILTLVLHTLSLILLTFHLCSCKYTHMCA